MREMERVMEEALSSRESAERRVVEIVGERDALEARLAELQGCVESARSSKALLEHEWAVKVEAMEADMSSKTMEVESSRAQMEAEARVVVDLRVCLEELRSEARSLGDRVHDLTEALKASKEQLKSREESSLSALEDLKSQLDAKSVELVEAHVRASGLESALLDARREEAMVRESLLCVSARAEAAEGRASDVERALEERE